MLDCQCMTKQRTVALKKITERGSMVTCKNWPMLYCQLVCCATDYPLSILLVEVSFAHDLQRDSTYFCLADDWQDPSWFFTMTVWQSSLAEQLNIQLQTLRDERRYREDAQQVS